MIRRPPRSTPLYSSAASDVYKRQTPLRPARAPSEGARPRGGRSPGRPSIRLIHVVEIRQIRGQRRQVIQGTQADALKELGGGPVLDGAAHFSDLGHEATVQQRLHH